MHDIDKFELIKKGISRQLDNGKSSHTIVMATKRALKNASTIDEILNYLNNDKTFSRNSVLLRCAILLLIYEENAYANLNND